MREILLFSLPSIAASLLEPLSGVVDTALVGHLDTALLAALAVGTTLLSSFTWVFNFLIHASTQSVASSTGEDIGSRTRISLTIALAIGCVSAFTLYLFRLPLYHLIGAEHVLAQDIDAYFLPRLLGHPMAILFMTALSLLRGLSRVHLALIFVAISTIFNIIFSWFFLYQWHIGLAGAAWGTVCANALGMLMSFTALALQPRVRAGLNKIPPRDEWFNFGKNALNLFGRSIALTGSLFLGAHFAAQDGAVALASHQILLQAWLFVSFFIDGVAITANIKGSELSRRNSRHEFQNLTHRVLLLGFCLGSVFSVFYFICAHFTQSIFTNDRAVLEVLDQIWPWIALTQIPNALAFVYDGLMFGLGAKGGFVWVRRWMSIGAIFVFLPIAALGGGLKSVWIGLIALNLFRLITGWWTTRHLTQKMSYD